MPSQVYAERQFTSSCDLTSFCKDSKWYAKSNCIPNKKNRQNCEEGDITACNSVCECDISPTGQPCDENNPNKDADLNNVFGRINPPPAVIKLGFGAAGVGQFFSGIVRLFYIFGSLIFIFYFIWGAAQWITSGGDKEGVAKARGKIIHAIVGVVLLGLSALIITVIGQITGFTFFSDSGESINPAQKAVDKAKDAVNKPVKKP